MTSEKNNGEVHQNISPNLLASLTTTLENVVELVHSIVEAQRGNVFRMEDFASSIDKVQAKIDRIHTVIHIGNGKESITTRIALIEDKIIGLTADFESLEGKAKLAEEHEHERELEKQRDKRLSKKLKYSLIAAVITSLAGVTTTTIQLLTQ